MEIIQGYPVVGNPEGYIDPYYGWILPVAHVDIKKV
jgi:hypothetical protein